MARKILLADDSVTAQNMGRKILTDAGYEVMTVNNGSAALKRVTEQKPDLIVLDVYMPGYSGLEVCQRLKDSRDTSRIPVLLTVGKLEPFKPEDARRVAADAFIVKPFEASELLSALTRLEDRIVPEGETSRFTTNVRGIDRFAGDLAVKRESSDSGEDGWKSRIRFPSKKTKKEEPEPEADYATPTALRDLRGGATEKASETKTARSNNQEAGLVPDIPRDITPDELDALSALVAKLDGPIPKAEEIAPIGDSVGPSGTPVQGPKAEAPAPSNSDAGNPDTPEVQSTAEVQTEMKAATVEVPAEAVAAESMSGTTKTGESQYTPAPVDRDDEPFFATAAAAVPQTSMEAEASVAETGAAAPTEQVSAPVEESQPPAINTAEGQTNQAKVEEMVAEAVAEQAIAEQATGEERTPTDEELAEALKLLTPVHDGASAQASGAGSNGQEGPSGAEARVDEHAAAAHAGNGSRWTAVPVELSSEEMGVSLEAEMFRSFAPGRAAGIDAAATVEASAAHKPGTSIMEAATAAEVATAAAAVVAEMVAANTPVVEPPTYQAAPEKKEDAPVAQSADPRVQEAVPVPTVEQATGDSGSRSSDSGSEAVPGAVAATTVSSEQDDEATGDQQSMGKHARAGQGKGSKSGWHQIHAATPSTNTDVDTAKHADAEPQAEESPKAMAAAAAADDSSSFAAGADPNAIASIVDSVLADLRPRIVEEIAKKLTKK